MRSCRGSPELRARPGRGHPRHGRWALHRLSLAAWLAGAMAASPSGWALPQGAVPTAGSVSVRADGSKQLAITQTSARAAIDWTSFSIAAGERVRIVQPDAAAVLFNRVTGADPSLILGQLQADGRVFLSNPRGVIFGVGSRVDVGSLVATTLNIDPVPLTNGRWQLSGGQAGTGELRADGEITAPGGTVALVGPRVSIGGNVLAGRLGAAAVGAVQVDVEGDGLIFFNARSEDLATRLDLSGSARALAGPADLRAEARAGWADTVLNLSGTVRASGLALRDGQVVIDGGRSGITRVSGEVRASADAAGTQGGNITVLGDQLQLTASARLDASGQAGGGSVRVGGDAQGAHAAALPHARSVVVEAGAQLSADAVARGDGGRVVLWSGERTQFAGAISTRGGAEGGNGGLVEVSSRGVLRFEGSADRRAPQGQAGVLLLDPTELTVQVGGSGDNVLSVTTLLSQLAAGPVTLEALDRITVAAAVSSPTGTTAGGLTLSVLGNDATDTITINQGISLQGAGRALTLAARNITIADVDMAASGLVLGGATTWTNAAARSVSLPISGTGSLTKAGAGTLTLSGANTYSGGTTVSAGTLVAGAASVAATQDTPASGAFGTGAVTVSSGASVDLAGLAVHNAWSLNGTGVDGLGALRSSSGTTGRSSGAITLAGNATLGVADGAALSLSGVIANADTTARALTKAGAGTLTLSGANTYSGGTTVSAGTLVAGAASVAATQDTPASGAFGTGAVTVSSGASVDLAGLAVHNAWSLSGTGVDSLGALRSSSGTTGRSSGAITLAGNATLGVADGAALSLSGVIANADTTAQALTKAGAGTLTLSGANTYSGGTTVSAGTLVAGAASVAATQDTPGSGAFGTGAVTVTSGASVDLAGLAVHNAWSLNGTGVDSLGALRSSSGTTGRSNGAITLAGNATLGVADGAALSLSGVIANADTTARALTKAGAGTLTLSGANTYSGGTTVSAGTLVAGAASVAATQDTSASGAFGTGAVTVSSGASVDLAGLAVHNAWSLNGTGVDSLGALRSSSGTTGRSSGAITLAGNATLGVADGAALSLSGVIADADATARALTKAGTGTLTLSGANTYSGGTTVSAGTLVAGSASVAATQDTPASGAFGTGAVTVTSGASVDIAGLAVHNAWLLSGTGVDSLGALRSSSGTAGRSSGAITLAGNATLGVADGAALVLSGAIGEADGTPRSLDKVGSGTLTLGGASSYRGGTTVSAGMLVVGTSDAAGQGALGRGTVTVAEGASVDLAGFTVDNDWTLTGRGVGGLGALRSSSGTAGRSSGAMTLAGDATVGVDAGAALTLGGAITEADATPRALAKAGAGTLTLGGLSRFGGGTTVSAGTLVAGRSSAASQGAFGSGAVSVADGASVDLAGFSVHNGWSLAGLGVGGAGALFNSSAAAASSQGAVVLTAAAGIGVGNAASVLTLSGGVSGAGSLSKLGAGTLRLASAAAPGAGTAVVQGLLEIADGGGLAGAIDIASGSLLKVSRSQDLTLSGPITGGGVLAQAGAGVLTLAGDATHTGGTTVEAGRQLQVGDGGQAGSLAGAVINQGLLRFKRSDTLVYGGVVSGGGQLEQAGSGTLVLTANQGHSGGTRVSAGTLQLGDGGAQGLVGDVDVATGAQLVFRRAGNLIFDGLISGGGGVTQAGRTDAGTSDTLSFSRDHLYTGTTTIAAGKTLRLGVGLAAGSVRGDIDNQGTLTVLHSDTLTLRGDLGGAGLLQLQAGDLQLTGARTATGATTVASGSRLIVDLGAASRWTGDLGGAGQVEKAGNGTLTVLGRWTPGGGTTVSQGTLQVGEGGDAGSLGGGAIDLAHNTQLVFQRSGTVSLDSVVSGRGSLVQSGSGSLTLGGASSYSGGTTVRAGTLVAGAASTGAGGAVTSGPFGTGQVSVEGGALVDLAGRQVDNDWRLDGASRLGSSSPGSVAASAGALQLAGNGTLAVSGTQLNLSGAIGGTGALTVQGPGTLVLSGANTASGGTTVTSGTLQLEGGSNRAGTGALQVDAGAVLDLRGGAQLSVPLTLGGTLRVAAGELAAAASGTVTLSADATLQVDGEALSLSGRLDDAGGAAHRLTKRGTGVLSLSGVNGSAGDLVVQAGTLKAELGRALSDTGTLQLAAGSTLQLLASETVGGLAGAGSVQLGGFTLSAGAGGGDQLFAGVLQGAGGLRKQGGGTLTLSGANTHEAGTQVLAGTLRLQGGTNRAGSGALQVASGATLDLRDGASLSVPLRLAGTLASSNAGNALAATLSGAVTLTGDATLQVGGAGLAIGGAIADAGGARALTKTGSGTLTLSGVNSSAGTLTVNAGTVVARNGQALSDSGLLQLAAGATLQLQADETVGGLAGAGAVVLDGATLAAGGNGASGLFDGVLSGRGGLTKQGGGTLTLNGANTYAGATQVQAGTLVLGASGTAGTLSAVTVAAGAQLHLQSSQRIGALAGAGAVRLDGAVLSTGGDGSSGQFDGVISGSGGVTQAGSGTLTLNGANSYTGGTTVSGGLLQAGRASQGSAGALTQGPFGTGTVSVGSAAQVDLAGWRVDNAWSLSGAGVLASSTGSAASAGALQLAGAGTLAVAGAQLSLGGAITGPGALTVQGPGTLVLSGANTARGDTTVASGTLQLLGGADRAGSGALQVASGATLDLRDGASLSVPLRLAGTLASSNAGNALAATLSGAVTLAGDATLQVGGAGLAISGAIADAGGARALTKTGSGTLTLSGVNSSAGTLTVNAGTVVARNGQALSDSGLLQLAAGATLQLQADETVGALAGAGAVVLDGATLAAGGNGASSLFDGVLSGRGGLTKQGAGTLTLNGANTYAGATQVQAGTLVLGASGTAGTLSAVTVAAGAQLALQSAQVLGSLAGAGDVALGAQALSTGADGLSTRFDGTLSGSGSLTKQGAGSFTLAGRNTHSGGTTVLAGQVVAGRGSEGPASALLAGPLGTGAVTVAAGAAVDLAGWQVDNAFTLNGGTALVNSLGRAAMAGALTLAADTTLGVSGAQLSLGGAITGPGALTVQGPGTLVLSGANTARGGTTVASGTLQLLGGADRAGSGALQVASGGTLDLRDGASLSVPLRLAGTLASSNAGNALAATLSGAVTLTGDATLQVGGAGLAISGAIADAGGARALTKTGSGTLTLSGVNSSAGTLTVNAGTVVARNGQALSDSGLLQLAAGATLQLQADETVGALAGGGAVVLDGATLAAGGNGASSLFDGVLSGRGGLTKQGAGTLTLNGANTYTGATQVQAGTLVLGASGTAGTLSAVTVAAGAQLTLQSAQVLGSLAGAGDVALGAQALSTGADGLSTRFDGTLSGSGSLTKHGAGSFTLGGRDARTGATQVAGGTLVLAASDAASALSTYRVDDVATLQLQADATLGALAGAGTVDLAPGQLRLAPAAGTSTLFSGTLQGSGGLVLQGAGTLTLSGANRHTGRTQLLGGTLAIAGDAQLGAAPAVLVADQLLLDGGTLRITGSGTLAATRGVTLQGAGGTLQLPAGVTVALDAPLADGRSAGALTLAGGGTLAFTSALDHTHSGGTLVQGSQLSLARDGQLGAAGAALTLDGGTLQLRDSLRLDSIRPLRLGAGGGTLDLAAGLSLQFGGQISDAAGAQDGRLTLQGGGSFRFDGVAASTYTGATALLGSTLALQRDDQLGLAPATARDAHLRLDGGRLVLEAGTLVLDARRGLALGAAGGTLQVADGATLSLAATVADATTGVAGTLTKAGAGTLQLGGEAPNRHSGGTVVLAGVLAIDRDEALGASAGALQLDGGTLRALGSFRLDAARALQLGVGGGRIDVADGATLALPGAVSEQAGAATLTKLGGGTLAFDGAADAARLGATQVLAGTLAITRDGQLGRAPAAPVADQLLLDGGTLRLDADLTLAASRGVALGAGGGTVAVAAGVAARVDGAVSDAGAAPAALRKTGTGRLTLAGDNRQSGGTELREGTLATAGAERLPDAGALQLAVGTRFELGGAETIGALADLSGVGAGFPARLVLDRHVLTVRQASDTRFSGQVDTGSGQLVKEGSGTLSLAGQGSGNGLFQVNSGLLVSASADLLTPDTLVQVAERATLRLDTAATVQSLTLAGELSGSGLLTVTQGTLLDGGTLRAPVSTATLTSRQAVQVQAALQVSGTATLEGGTLTLGEGGLLQAARVQLVRGAALLTTAAGQLGAGAALSLSGGSMLQLAGAETAASLSLAEGSRAAGSGRLGLAGAVSLADSGLALPVQAAQFSSSGSSTVSAALSLSQSAALRDGSLTLAEGGRIDSPVMQLQSGVLRSTDAQALGSGASALRVDAPATLQLGAPATVATLSLAGTVQPAAPASAATALLSATQSVTLDGGQLAAPLLTRSLEVTGASSVAATVQATESASVAGTLTLDAGGALVTPRLALRSGGLLTRAEAQLGGAPVLSMDAGTVLQLAGSETLGALIDGGGAAGLPAARVLLGAGTLGVGGAVADAATVQRFSGVFSGAGSLAKQGAGTWVLNADQAHGDTRIEAGTLQLGTGGASGTAGRGGIVNDGLLRVQRSDTLALDNAITGRGSLEQAGSGTLVLGAAGNAYTGATRVLAGTLATAGAERLPDASAVQVAAEARLQLRGSETLAALSADGAVSLGGALSASSGGLRFGGPVSVDTTVPVTLSAPDQAIEALNDGNRWGAQPLSVRAGQLRLSAGREADGRWRDLVLGEVVLSGRVAGAAGTLPVDRQASAGVTAQADGSDGSLLVANRIQLGTSAAATGDARLDGLLQVDGGALTLRAMATPDYSALPLLDSGRQAVDPQQGRLLQVADDVITQGAASRIDTVAGAGLVLQAAAGGSIALGNADNRFAGTLQALSGSSWNSAWQPVALAGERAVGQSRITLAGRELVVGGQGLEADLVRVSAGRLATVDDSRIAARLWYNDSGFGIQNSAPGLVLELLPQAFSSATAFGSADAPIAANVGGKSLGERGDGLAAGYVQLLPRKAASGGTVVFLAGPSATQAGEAGYRFFNDAAGDQAQVPLFYNGVLPATPQLSGSLSAVASVSENARRERFEETVRTENVAIRLRAGVIAEVGPGRPATGGAEGLRAPQACAAEAGRLDCAAPGAAATPARTAAPGAAR
ncbi:autotransporter-associated beta strand repeat-containing protein [Ideonella sp. DXS22W]|uniref:Autotransporter-associated beta strand repeat-containing protein n=1 Tax=Pseudaquabacterium inlustre TaxID=2984192 RepID=A0ABU9CF78_9BURK